jgi:hypothetical protein
MGSPRHLLFSLLIHSCSRFTVDLAKIASAHLPAGVMDHVFLAMN